MRYDIYQDTKNKDFRLVLEEGAAFPSETSADQWVKHGTCDENQVNQQTKDDIAEKGYSLTKIEVNFTESHG